MSIIFYKAASVSLSHFQVGFILNNKNNKSNEMKFLFVSFCLMELFLFAMFRLLLILLYLFPIYSYASYQTIQTNILVIYEYINDASFFINLIRDHNLQSPNGKSFQMSKAKNANTNMTPLFKLLFNLFHDLFSHIRDLQ